MEPPADKSYSRLATFDSIWSKKYQFNLGDPVVPYNDLAKSMRKNENNVVTLK